MRDHKNVPPSEDGVLADIPWLHASLPSTVRHSLGSFRDGSPSALHFLVSSHAELKLRPTRTRL